MSLTLLRRTASAATLTLALTGLAACGGGDDTSGSDAAGSNSSSSSAPDEADGGEDVGSEESEDSEEAVPTAGEEIDASEMADVFKTAFEGATTASVTQSIGGGGEGGGFESTGVIDFSTTPLSMAISIDVPQAPKPIQTIIVDGFIYQNIFGDKFTKTALDDPANPTGDLSDQLDIGEQFETFEKAITAATYVGEEDGLEHYSLVLDSGTLLDEQGTDLGSLPAGSIPETFTYDLWFDDEGNLRKMQSDLGDIGGELLATYDNWGEPVEIVAPDASQIMQMPGA
ncbi:hypothetical protein [Nocardioides sp.]|uniref:hypothetical protein n=1 Tax=Nocardioides sp. TaxID=35761 RepID=UPI00286A4794|nr:hypothetical protein [Nocardioides sp.]